MAKVDLGVDCDLSCRNLVPSISAKKSRIDPLPERLDPLLGAEHCYFLGADYSAVDLDSSVHNSAF